MPASTPLELVRIAAGYLAEKGIEGARLDAEILLAHALDVPRIQLYLQFDKPLETREVDAYRELVRRRARREPAAYVTGCREFWSLALRVDPRVLIPRPETERLVEAALERMEVPSGRLADLGTGSGAIALALLSERTGWEAVGTDVSDGALAVAAENAGRLGLQDRFEARRGDLVAPLGGESFDLVVSNPPYIPSGDLATLEPEVCGYEPRAALDGGVDGLDVLRRVAVDAPRVLRPGGWLVVEFGAGQGAAVRGLLEAGGAYADVRILSDYTGRPRVAAARRH
ncbi:MAG: peptide chain release factor N(5)-glutamine methyltransferase [Deltaproteobacteria bacterium]|nr:peptide chain release factor N(5)-glutamine methyltransferase [Deltaproteobacteria bacterium]